MHPCDNHTSDSEIIALLAKDDKAAWVQLYDKYAIWPL